MENGKWNKRKRCKQKTKNNKIKDVKVEINWRQNEYKEYFERKNKTIVEKELWKEVLKTK